MSKIKVLGLCGSLRGDSWNLKLLKAFLAGLDTARFDTRVHGPLDLPLMNQDLEGKPLDPRILALRDAVADAQVIVFASPEYNASVSPALKNAIDWASRPPANVWTDKLGVLLAASPGMLGGARGLIHLRSVLSGLKVWLVTEQVQVPKAPEAFDAKGAVTSEPVRKQMAAATQALETLAKKMIPAL